MANPNEADEVNSGALAMVIAVVAFATLAVALVVTALVRQEVQRVGGAGMDKQDRPFVDGKSEQVASLKSAPTWSDKAKGLLSIPIDRAIELTLEAVRKNPYALTPGTKKDEAMGGAGNEPDEAAAPASSAETKAAESKPAEEKKPAEKKPAPKAAAPAAPAPSAAAPTTP